MLFLLSFLEYGSQNKAPIAFGKAINAQDLVWLFSQHPAILTENGVKFHRSTNFNLRFLSNGWEEPLLRLFGNPSP